MSTSNLNFLHAPHGWNENSALTQAAEQKLSLTNDHWVAISGLQEYFSKHEIGNRRELADALNEKFHSQGGLKYLYKLFPGGPVAQGCALAGIAAPAGSVDLSFGSVV